MAQEAASKPDLLKELVFQETHEVFNQVPPFENYNAFTGNRRLVEAFEFYTGEYADRLSCMEKLIVMGKQMGDAANLHQAHLANVNIPQFKPFDSQGRRVNAVQLSDHYHYVMRIARENEVCSYQWARNPKIMDMRSKGMFSYADRDTTKTPGSQEESACVARSVLHYLYCPFEPGTSCPLTMSYSAVACLLDNTGPKQVAHDGYSGDFTEWITKLTEPFYDPRDIHISLKKSVFVGMSMTEKQGGSDVRSNTTVAERIPSELCEPNPQGYAMYRLRGHKWFTSAPMCDAFLTLANTEKGPTCFLVPRWLSPAVRNQGLRFQQLKNKIGDRANASSEVEYHGAIGYAIGQEGMGIQSIMQMVNHTRLDCMIGSTALMSSSLMSAIHFASHRSAFGEYLVNQPLMSSLLSDLALEAEAATALSIRVAATFKRRSPLTDMDHAFQRIAVTLGKYHICKLCPTFVYECLECHGGNGYVDDTVIARNYRQAPLNSIWEGSGNVITLDLFRQLKKDKLALKALELEVQRSNDHHIQSAFDGVIAHMKKFSDESELHGQGRRTIEILAIILQSCALRAFGPKFIADLFIQTRLGTAAVVASTRGRHYGTLRTPPTKEQARKILERFTALPPPTNGVEAPKHRPHL